MNKITKLGVSALCGSLAAVSAAHAGEMVVKGGATMTYTSLSEGVTGNPLGMATNLTFAGSGELDNGSAVAINIAHDDQNGYSASDISLDIAGIGKFSFDQGGGTGLDRLDDKMPTAWEETTGTGVGTGLVNVTGVGAQTDIEWAISSDLLPGGMSAYIAYSPKVDGSKNNDKVTSGSADDGAGSGYDVVVEYSGAMEGLNLFAGYSDIERNGKQDLSSNVMGFTYATGGLTFGVQQSYDGHGDAGGTDAYTNTAYGVSFNVNDDLSISYGQNKSKRNENDNATVESTVKAKSLQAAYSMGGATVKVAKTTVDNGSYTVGSTAGDNEGITVALSLAF
jgi:hypothetical protein